jgi:hypothetical protein
MKNYGTVDLHIHIFLISALVGVNGYHQALATLPLQNEPDSEEKSVDATGN